MHTLSVVAARMIIIMIHAWITYIFIRTVLSLFGSHVLFFVAVFSASFTVAPSTNMRCILLNVEHALLTMVFILMLSLEFTIVNHTPRS